MLRLQASGVRIAATAVAVPRVLSGAPPGRTGPVDNETLVATRYQMDTDRGRSAAQFLLADLRDRVGLQVRHHAHAPGTPFLDGEETSADLAARAGEEALLRAGLAVSGLGAVLVATSTPPRWTATTAALAAVSLSFEGTFLDVRMGCAGGIAALLQGALLVRASGQPVLVMAADTFSTAAPPGEVLAALALGDAGAACLLIPGAPDEGFVVGALEGAPSLAALMTTPGTLPPSAAQIEGGAYFLAGDPEAMGVHALPRYQAVLSLLQDVGAPDLVLLHQTQRPLMARVLKEAMLDDARALSWLAEYANTGTANVLLGLHRARQDARWRTGARVVMAAVGGGLAAAGATYRVVA